jgi:hypothetical protein
MTTVPETDGWLDGVDLDAERHAFAAHDIDALHAGVRDRIARAEFRRGVGVGVGAAVVVALARLVGGLDNIDASPNASSDASSDDVSDHVEPAAAALTTAPAVALCPPPVHTTPSAAPIPERERDTDAAPRAERTTRPASSTPPSTTTSTAVARAALPPPSRLKVWLARYASAEVAFAAGDVAAAASEARALRESAPEGALATEAALLELRALRLAGRSTEAAALRAILGDDVNAAGKDLDGGAP